MLARISIYEDSNDDIEQTSSGKSRREGLPGVHGKARYKLSLVLVAATKLIKASARSGGREISRNVFLLLAQWLNPYHFTEDNERQVFP